MLKRHHIVICALISSFVLSATIVQRINGESVEGAAPTVISGSQGSIQINNRGRLGSDPNLTFSTITKTLTVPKIVVSTMGTVYRIEWANGTIQVSSPTNSGGGGGSSLEVFNNSDGTALQNVTAIGLTNAFNGSISGSTYTMRINFSSVASQSDLSNYLTLSSATNTYFPISSSGTFLPVSSSVTFIWNTNDLQTSPSRFNVSSGTVQGKFSTIGQIEITNTNDFDEAIYVHMPQENTKYALRVDGYYSDGIRFDGELYTNNASISNLFAINDNSVWKPSTANTAWSIGAAPIIYGTSPAAGLYGFVSSPTSRPSPPSFVYYGTATKVAAYMASPFWSTGQINDYYGFYVSTFNLSSTVNNAFGLFVSSVTGATNNYSVKTHTGKVEFGTPGATSALTFDPSGGGLLNLYNSGSPNWGQNFYSGSSPVGYLNYGTGGFTIAISSGFSLDTLASRFVMGIDGVTTINNLSGSTILSIRNSSVSIMGQRPFVLQDSDSSNYVGFVSSKTIPSNVVWTLPSADSSGCFQSNGSGTVSIGSCGSGSGGGSLEVFSNFDATKSSPTSSIAIGDALKLTVSGSTAIVTVDFSSVPSRGDVILKQNTLQSGSTFYVSSGTVQGQFIVKDGTFTYRAGTQGATARFELDFSSHTGSDTMPVVKFYDKYGYPSGGLFPGNPRTYFDAIGGMNTISYVNISGAWGGGGDTFRILGPWQTFGSATNPAMLSVRSDIDDAAFQVNCNNFNGSSTNGYIMLGGRFTNQQTFAINHDGGIYWSSGTTQGINQLPTANSNFDTNLYRSTQDVLKTDDSFDIGVDLTVGGSGTITSSLAVDAAGGVALSQFGASPPSEIVSFSSSNDRLGISKDDAATAGAVRAGVFVAYFNGTGNHSGSFQANNGFAGTASSTSGNLTNTSNGGGIKVYRGVVDHNGKGTVSQASSFTGGTRLDSTGTITNVATFHSEGLLARTTGGRVDNYSHFWARNGVAASTVQYGVRIDALSIATTNYPIALDGSGGIYFNTPTNNGNENIASENTGEIDYNAQTAHDININRNRVMRVSGSTVSVVGWITTSTSTIYPVPSVACTGTTAILSKGSTDNGGKITVGGGVTASCTLTFGTVKSLPPPCSAISDIAIASMTGATTNSTFVIGGTSLTSAVIMYTCIGNQ